MTTHEISIEKLQCSLRRTQWSVALLAIGIVALAMQRYLWPAGISSDELRTHHLVMLDDHGVKRVEIGQDPINGPRRARSAGIWIFDNTGHERGGMSTFDDGSVGTAFDAPYGVGSQPQDRIGMGVDEDGSAHLLLTDNQTGGVLRLISPGDGTGGLQLIKADYPTKQVLIRTLDYGGERRETIPMPS